MPWKLAAARGGEVEDSQQRGRDLGRGACWPASGGVAL